MARTKGSKNKPKEEAAAAAIMPEDLEFDRELERIAQAQALPPEVSDRESIREIVKDEPRPEMLHDLIECGPANTDEEFRTQVQQAKMHGCDSIEVTIAQAKRWCHDPLLESVGYFIFHDVKVYLEGHFAKASARDKQTIEHRVFGVKA